MKAIIDELEAIATACTGSPDFAHDHNAMLNIVADHKTGPVVFAPALGIGTIDVSGAGIIVVQRVAIEFLQQTQFQNLISENVTIIEDMFELALEYVQRLKASTVIEVIMTADRKHHFDTDFVYETFDANFAGIMLTFDCKLRKPTSFCTPILSP